jgi:serralysin
MSIPLYPLVVYGVGPGTIADHTATGGFTVEQTDATPATVIGVTDTLAGFATSAPNTVFSEGENASALGDAQTVAGFVLAGRNTVTSEARGFSDAAGDAVTLEGFAQAGHNSVTASANGIANAYGDAYLMTGFAKGGDNTVSADIGQGGPANLYGDAYILSGFASGGHNTLSGASPGPEATWTMYGDAYELTDFAHGGGNTLTSPGFSIAPVTMYGDGYELLGHASGGDNTLVAGGRVEDIMYGDAAIVSRFAQTQANTFSFSPGIGQDVIMDFRSGEDHIDLQGFGLSSFQQLEQLLQTTANGLDIVFNSTSSILLHGVSQVAAGDFVFS